jgi:DNA-binding CsgD family transcriptional regulator
MISTEPRSIVEQFRNAALGLTDWTSALAYLGKVFDSPVIQLAAVGSNGDIPVHHASGVSEDAAQGFIAERGFDPSCNPRTQRLLSNAPWQCITDEDLTPAERSRWPIYDFLRRFDADQVALTRFRDVENLVSAIVVMRSTRAGPFDATETRRLVAATPGIEEAFRAALLLGSAQDRVVIDTAERLGNPVLLIGADREIVSLSPSAEQIVRRGTELSTTQGRLIATDPVSDLALEHATRAASLANPGDRGGRRIKIRGRGTGRPLGLHLFALPPRLSGPISRAQVMVRIDQTTTHDLPDEPSLRRSFALTGAEAAVARLLADGHDLRAIAERRGSSVQTVRSQLKTIFEKTGTHRQAELAILLRQLG